jgi:hypothetical protein
MGAVQSAQDACKRAGRLSPIVTFASMSKDIQMPNGDFLKNYPDVTRVEVITREGREFVRYECSNVQVSLQDDGQTLKVFLFSTYD